MLNVTPAGVDPTRVYFFSMNTSLEYAKKNIQIHGSATYAKEFGSVIIDGRTGVLRTQYNPDNDCTSELGVIEKRGVVYGFSLVQCPTHPQGYDELRRDIADSLKLFLKKE